MRQRSHAEIVDYCTLDALMKRQQTIGYAFEVHIRKMQDYQDPVAISLKPFYLV